MKLDYEVIPLKTRHPFRISRARPEGHFAVIVRITDSDQRVGWGEANPSRYYGETPETVCAALEIYRSVIESVSSPFPLQEIETACENDLRGQASARAAISAALYDLIGKRMALPVHQLLGLDPSQAPLTSFTIAIDEPAAMRERVREADAYPILKIKVGTGSDEQRLSIIREEAPGKPLRVDANGAWRSKEALDRIARLSEFELELVEQPVAPHDVDGLRFVRERSPLPIIADESCLTSRDIPSLVGAADGINIKLAKCGGISEALRMIYTAQTLGLRVMIGCMIGTSLAMAAAAQLTPLADYADLDGAALLAEDPFYGLSIDRGRLHLSADPGLGVKPK